MPISIALITAVFLIVAVESSEYPTGNAGFCDGIQDAAKQLACRKHRAGSLYCSDRTQCQNVDSLTEKILHPPYRPRLQQLQEDLLEGGTELFLPVYTCSDHDAARRIGMTCNNFPYYNGGYPMMAGGIKWDDEWEFYHCTNVTSNDKCAVWSGREDSEGEYEIGTFTCQKFGVTDLGFSFCQAWSSVQRETKKCSAGTSRCEPDCEQPTYCRKQCCSDSGCYDCSYHPITEYEYSTGNCTTTNDYGACLEWTEEEYDQHNVKFREYATYKCLELSENQEYCRRWFGNIDSEEEFELSTCQCLSNDSDDIHSCSVWMCYEQGLSYYFPNYIWVLLPLLVGLGCFCCCGGFPVALEEEEDAEDVLGFMARFCASLVFWPLAIAVAFLAGLAGVFISVAIFIFCWFTCFRIRDLMQEPEWQTTSTSPSKSLKEEPPYGIGVDTGRMHPANASNTVGS